MKTLKMIAEMTIISLIQMTFMESVTKEEFQIKRPKTGQFKTV